MPTQECARLLDTVEEYELVDLFAAGRTPQLRSMLMEGLSDRFMRQIAFALFQRMRQAVQLLSCINGVITHDAALAGMPDVMLAAIVDIRPLRGRMLIVADGFLIGAVVDAMCGANNGSDFERSELSVMETRIGKQIIELTMTTMLEVFGNLTPLNWTLLQFETATGMLAIADAQDWMISTTGIFETALGIGSIRVIAPFSSFEPLEVRATSPSALLGQSASDRSWERSLDRLTEETRVELRLELVRQKFQVGILASLHPGLTIPCKILNDAIAVIGEVDLFHADFGQQDGYVCCRPKPADLNEGAAMTETKDVAPPDYERVELERLKAQARNSPAISSQKLVERVPVLLTVELGRTSISVKDLRALRHGQVVVLDQMAGEPLAIFANAQRLGAGEVVSVGRDQYGIRITSLADENEGTEEVAA
jgi:flagellar motor switch protein FliN/FliY